MDSAGQLSDGLLAWGQRMRRLAETAAPRDHHKRFLAGADGGYGGCIQALRSSHRKTYALRIRLEQRPDADGFCQLV